MRLAFLLIVFLTACHAEIRGGALVTRPAPGILTWGSQLLLWPLNGGEPRVLLQKTDFGPGGCVADVDNDGQDDLLVQEHPGAGRMVWLKAPEWTAATVEERTEFHDCLPFTIQGKRGVVVPHLNAQLRFYQFPNFEYKEIYSIYTNSQQGGLLEHDVDGDGLPDLFFGNYWVRNPGQLGVAWRLFTINTFFDTPTAALAALGVWDHNTLIWAETSAKQARIAVFEAPEDRKQLWNEHRLEPLDEPKAVLVHPQGVFIGHAGGVVLESPSEGGWRRTTIAQGFPVLKLVNWRDNVIAICPDGVRWVFPLR